MSITTTKEESLLLTNTLDRCDADSAPPHEVSTHSTTCTLITKVDHKPLHLMLLRKLSEDVAPSLLLKPFLQKQTTSFCNAGSLSKSEFIPLSQCNDNDLDKHAISMRDMHAISMRERELNLKVERALCDEMPEIFGYTHVRPR